jgi:hypothetical protein
MYLVKINMYLVWKNIYLIKTVIEIKVEQKVV